MIYKEFPLTIRTEEDAEVFEKLPKGKRTEIILKLVREYVKKEEGRDADSRE